MTVFLLAVGTLRIVDGIYQPEGREKIISASNTAIESDPRSWSDSTVANAVAATDAEAGEMIISYTERTNDPIKPVIKSLKADLAADQATLRDVDKSFPVDSIIGQIGRVESISITNLMNKLAEPALRMAEQARAQAAGLFVVRNLFSTGDGLAEGSISECLTDNPLAIDNEATETSLSGLAPLDRLFGVPAKQFALDSIQICRRSGNGQLASVSVVWEKYLGGEPSFAPEEIARLDIYFFVKD